MLFEEDPIYFITGFNESYMNGLKLFNGDIEYPDGFSTWSKDEKTLWRHNRRESKRTFGYFKDIDTAREAVTNNWCNIFETDYMYVVIESIHEGVHGFSDIDKVEWYKYDLATEKYYKIDQPEYTKCLCNFGCG